MSSLEQVLEAALSLPEPDRLRLVDSVLDSMSPSVDRPFDDAWLAEIQRRSREFDAGQVVPIPWSKVKERARQAAQS